MFRSISSETIRFAVYSFLFLLIFVITFLLFGHSLEQFARHVFERDWQNGTIILVSGGLLAADPVLPTPSSLIATLLGARIGFWSAFLVNGVSLSLACVFAYALGRAGATMMENAGRKIPSPVAAWLRRNGLIAVLLCRPVPILAEASLMFAGAARHAPGRLLAWCSLTQFCLGAAYAFAGSGWGTDDWNTFAIFTGSIAIPLAAGFLVTVLIYRSAK